MTDDMNRIVSSVLSCLLAMLLLTVQSVAPAEDLASTLRRALSGQAADVDSAAGQPVRARETLQRFYSARDYKPAWSGRGSDHSLEQLLAAIGSADQHGLNPQDYHLQRLREAGRKGDALAVELLATDAYLTLGAHLLDGKLNPLSIEPDWTANRMSRDLGEHLSNALASRRIDNSL